MTKEPSIPPVPSSSKRPPSSGSFLSLRSLPTTIPLWVKSGPAGGTHFYQEEGSAGKHSHFIEHKAPLCAFQNLVINFVWLKLQLFNLFK